MTGPLRYVVAESAYDDQSGTVEPRRDPDDPTTLERIRRLRAEVRLRDARPNDGRCGRVAEALETEFGWQRQSGYLKLLDESVSWVHCWNLLDDGSILDATADQFQDLWHGDVIMINSADPRRSHQPAGCGFESYHSGLTHSAMVNGASIGRAAR